MHALPQCLRPSLKTNQKMAVYLPWIRPFFVSAVRARLHGAVGDRTARVAVSVWFPSCPAATKSIRDMTHDLVDPNALPFIEGCAFQATGKAEADGLAAYDDGGQIGVFEGHLAEGGIGKPEPRVTRGPLAGGVRLEALNNSRVGFVHGYGKIVGVDVHLRSHVKFGLQQRRLI